MHPDVLVYCYIVLHGKVHSTPPNLLFQCCSKFRVECSYVQEWTVLSRVRYVTDPAECQFSLRVTGPARWWSDPSKSPRLACVLNLCMGARHMTQQQAIFFSTVRASWYTLWQLWYVAAASTSNRFPPLSCPHDQFLYKHMQGVVYDPASHSQRFFNGHCDNIKCLAVDSARRWETLMSA